MVDCDRTDRRGCFGRSVWRLAALGAWACGFAAPLIVLAGCDRAPRPRDANVSAPARQAGRVADRTPSDREAGWLGVVLPRQSLDLAPETAGQVVQVYVDEGDTLRRGQTVAVLGAAHDRQELSLAEMSLRAAEADVSKSRLELADAENRLTRRHAQPDVFPLEEIRRAEIQKEMAVVDLEGTRARAEEQRVRVAQARVRLDQATLRAPVDGTVTRRYIGPGAIAGPGQPVIRMIGDGSLIVRFAVPPDQARSMRANMRVALATEGGSVPAVIESVSSEVDPPSGMVMLVAALDVGCCGADRLVPVKPGSVVRVHLASESAVPGEGVGGT